MANKHIGSIALVGALYIDTILDTATFPEEDSKLRATSRVIRAGGNTINSIHIIKQYQEQRNTGSGPILLISVLPKKSSKDYQIAQQSLLGVNLAHAIIRDEEMAAPSSYIIRSDATGSRTIVNFNNLAELSNEELITAYQNASKEQTLSWIHFEGRNPSAVKACVEHIRQQNTAPTISLEIEKPGRLGLSEIAPYVDYVFFSKSWALQTPATNLEQFLLNTFSQMQLPLADDLPKVYTKWAFCTWGEEGSGAVNIQGQTFLPFIALAVVSEGQQVLDTVGAGDVFIGSVISSLNAAKDGEAEVDMLSIMKEANRVCVNKIGKEGFDKVV